MAIETRIHRRDGDQISGGITFFAFVRSSESETRTKRRLRDLPQGSQDNQIPKFTAMLYLKPPWRDSSLRADEAMSIVWQTDQVRGDFEVHFGEADVNRIA